MTGTHEKAGAAASFASAAMTVAAMGIGIGIMHTMGVTSGMEVATASADQLRPARPLLIAAELVKIASGIAAIVAVDATRRRWNLSIAPVSVGYVGAALIIAAGVLGLIALLRFSPASSSLAKPVAVLGLLSLPATGLWAALASWSVGSDASRALRMSGILLAAAAAATFVYPPVGLLFGIMALIWWILLGLNLRRPASRAI